MDLPEPRIDPETARERADDILAGKEFRREDNAIGSGIGWIVRQLGRFFGALFGGGGGGAGLVVAIIVLVAVVAAIGWLILRRPRRPRRSKRDRTADVDIATSERPSTDWGATAAAHEAKGEWRQALRARYRELLASLYEQRLLADLAGRTAGEYRRELATAAPRAELSFGAVTDRFERAWYSEAPVGAAEVSQFREDAARTLADVGGRELTEAR